MFACLRRSRGVLGRVRELWSAGGDQVHVNDRRADLAIMKNGRTVYAELRYYQRPIQSNVVHQVIGFAAVLSAPVLLIANSQLANSARALIDRKGVDFVQWRVETDNPELHTTVERMFAEVNHNDDDVSGPNGNI